MHDDAPRGRGLSGRVALWTSGAALLGLLSFAAAVYGVLLLEAGEHEGVSPEPEGSEDPDESIEAEVGEDLLWAMLFAVPPSLVITVGATVWASRRAFEPLAEVTRAATEITAADLGRRLEVKARDRDLQALVVAFNELLARLDAGVEALDRYAADVSHELRTPLATSITELEVALRTGSSVEDWEQQARRTLEDLRGLAGTADALLELARSSTGAGLPRERVEIGAAVRVPLQRAEAEAERRGIALGVELPDAGRELCVAGSEPLLQGALSNLIDNALKHAGRGGRVTIAASCSEERVRISVEDSGPGVADEDLERLFHPFERGGSDTVREGYGLGLSIAHRVVVAHGGTLGGGSSSLGGAAFWLELPLARRR